MPVTSRLQRALNVIQHETFERPMIIYRSPRGHWFLEAPWRGQQIQGVSHTLTDAAEKWLDIVEKIKAAMNEPD